MRGWMNRWGMMLCALAGGLVIAGVAEAQCTVQIRERFMMGPRQVGGNGSLRDMFIGDGIGGMWAESSVPAGRRWLTAQVDTAGWAFGGSTTDSFEIPEEVIVFTDNGIGFGGGHNAALIPVQPPSNGRVTVQGHPLAYWSPGRSIMVGFSSSPSVLVDNFASFGQMWLELHGNDDYSLWVQGNATPLATGVIDWGYFSWTGFLRVELTYDVTANAVRATVGVQELGPFPLPFTPTITHAGFESHADDGVLMMINNFAVITGPSPTASASPSSATTVCSGGSVTMTATTNATGPVRYFWHHNGAPIEEGVHASGVFLDQLTVSGLSAARAGEYSCVILTECGVIESTSVIVSVNLAADLNQDGMVNGADLSVMLTQFGGFAAPEQGADLNGDFFVNSADLSVMLATFGQACP